MSEHDATDPAATPNPVFARDAFVSYANQDTAVAETVCANLERHGLRCWIAPRDVVPGALYADSIVRAINGTKLMVLVLSQHSVASPHVSKEIERASSKRRPIIALRIDTAPLTPALEYFLSESQWVDATIGGLDAALAKLSEAIRFSLLSGAHALAPAPAGLGTPPPAPSAHSAPAPTPPVYPAGAPPAPARRAARHSPWVYAVPVAAITMTFAYGIAVKWIDRSAANKGVGATAVVAASDGAAATVDKSVAVLPFEDLSENRDQGYFSDGLSGELIDLLAKVPGLRVPARTSSFYFKGKQATLQEIAKALNVTHLLEGTVRKSGQNLRITTDLVRVDTGSPMWSETYDRKLDDVFKIQDDIAGAVVSALKVSLLGGTVPRATPTANSAAYTAYLKCWKGGDNREAMALALKSCEDAVALDPNFAPGWLGLASILQGQFSAFGDAGAYEVVRPKIQAAIERALALDPKDGDAHLVLALVYATLDLRLSDAKDELQRASSLDPQLPFRSWMTGYFADVEGRYDEAIVALEVERKHDPLDLQVNLEMGNTYYRWGKLSEAANAFRAALGLDASAGTLHYRLGLVALAQGDPTAALAEFEQEPDRDFRAVGPPLALYALGRKAEADRALAAAELSAAQGAAYQIALIYAARKDTDGAFKWLDRAYAQRDTGMLWMKFDPLLRDLRPDPRFQALLRKLHLE
jgi:TolB-like protein/tetratricopeptide (TPR) repeat protein